MPLATGTHLGNYEIVALLRVGGMGEVYRARDTKLGREVALKVLPAEVSSNAERFARCEREARTVAGLSHPIIVVLHTMANPQRDRDSSQVLGSQQEFVNCCCRMFGEQRAARVVTA